MRTSNELPPSPADQDHAGGPGGAINFDLLFDQSDALAAEVIQVIEYPLYDDRDRFRVSNLLCSLSMEHAHSARALLAAGLMSSALVIHRAQFEAVMRSIWSMYAASDGEVGKLANSLTLDTEQAAKNLPSASVMMAELAEKAPAPPVEALREFMKFNWKALNSYVHAGIHPVRRHMEGYPAALILEALLNVNGMLMLAAMQASILTGVPGLQRQVLEVGRRYPGVLRVKPD